MRSFTQFYAPRQKWQARFQFKLRAPVFGDAAATRERMLDPLLPGKEKRADVHPLCLEIYVCFTLFSQLRACEALKWQAPLAQLWAFPPPDS
jgi:hypothetical protein